MPPEVLTRILAFLVASCPRSALRARGVCKTWKEVFDDLVHCRGVFISIGRPLGWEYVAGWDKLRSMTVVTDYHDVSPVLAWFRGLGVFDVDDLNFVLLAFSASVEIYGSPNYPYGLLRSDKFGLKYFKPDDVTTEGLFCSFNTKTVWDIGDDMLVFVGYNKYCMLTMGDSPEAQFAPTEFLIQNRSDVAHIPFKKGIHIRCKSYDVFILKNGVYRTGLFRSSRPLCVDATDKYLTLITDRGIERWTPETGDIEKTVLDIDLKKGSRFVDGDEIYIYRDAGKGTFNCDIFIFTYDPVTNTINKIDEDLDCEWLMYWYPKWTRKLNFSLHLTGSNQLIFPSCKVGTLGIYNLLYRYNWHWGDYDAGVLTIRALENNESGIPCLHTIKLYLNLK